MNDRHYFELNRNFASRSHEGLGRRAWLGIFGQTAAVLAAATAEAGAAEAAPTDTKLSASKSAAFGPLILAGAGKSVVDTSNGKVRGYTRNGIFTFKGMPYAETTSGKNRFAPPVKPKPWTGIRSSLSLGPAAPQSFNCTMEYRRAAWRHDEEAFMFEWEDGQPGEDCCHLNIWTPAISDNRKRPVMVWIHGGGFFAGSCDELRAYDGENLARRGDVVVVSMNHRLGALGYLNLAEYGDRYQSSANVGQLDLVASLEWVRDNISNFGGDPAKVFIFGQSGGGSKVSTLLAMPAAKGLFHRASIQSGGSLRAQEKSNSAKSAAEVVGVLGLSKSNIDRILEVPYYDIVKAGEDAGKKYGALAWGPTVDGAVLPRHPFDPDGPGISAGIPLMIGTVLNENANSIQQGDPAFDDMTMDDAHRRVAQLAGAAKADSALAIFQKNHPNAKPAQLWSRIYGASRRQNAINIAERKAAQKSAPVYNYWFAWQSPVLDGRAGAYHTSELPFCFNNTDRCAYLTGGGADARALALKVADAWIAFAKNGDPNHPGLPKWTAFNAVDAPVMIFDNECACRNNPDKDEREAIKV